jgi:hypothetical protein
VNALQGQLAEELHHNFIVVGNHSVRIRKMPIN